MRIYYGKTDKRNAVLFGKDAKRFTQEMKRVERMSKEQRQANREKLMRDAAAVRKEWNLTFEGFRGW